MSIYRDIFIALFVVYCPVLLMISIAYVIENKKLTKIMKFLERKII